MSIAALDAQRESRRAAGVCISCGAEREPGKTLCAEHLRYQKEQHRRIRSARASQGLCLQCGAAADGRRLCARHRAEQARRRRWRVKKRQVLAATRERLRLRAISEGRCSSWLCRSMATVGTLCEEHADPEHTRRLRLRANRKSVAAAKEAGLCTRCRWPNDRPGRSKCSDCSADDTEHKAANAAERRSRGLCSCGRRPRRGFATCARCARGNRLERRRQRSRNKAMGLCSRCRRPAEGMGECIYHRTKRSNDRQRLRRRRNGIVVKQGRKAS